MKLFFKFLVLIFLALILAFTSCSDGSSSNADDTENTIPPPENLLGTIALDNGEAAVMDLQFGDIAAGTRASTVSVSGKIRYKGADYIVGGLYDYSTGALDIFAKNTTSGLKFVFSGTYTETAGFSGTVKLYAADETTVLATGSASAVSATDSEKSSLRVFTGTFGGDAWGVWNGTLSGTSFYGTYAGEESGSGSFIMTRSGNSLTMTSTTTGIPSGTGTIIEAATSGAVATASGRWVNKIEESGYIETVTGTWSGAEVDSNYDVSVPNASYDAGFLANLILQALDNAFTTALYIGETYSGDFSSMPNMDGSSNDYDPSEDEDYSVLLTGYTDPQTGLILTGQMLVVITGDDVEIYVDDDITDYNSMAAPPDFGTGMEITFTDNSSVILKVSAKWDDSASSFVPGTISNGPYWWIGTTSVLASITQVY